MARTKRLSSLGAFLLFFSSACGDSPPSGNPDMSVPTTSLKEADNADVTLIFPLPQDPSHLLLGTDKGAHGDLVPSAPFGQIPGPLDPRLNRATSKAGEAGRAGLRLTALRVDPCFAAEGESPNLADPKCKNQIRLVFQGVRKEGAGTLGDDGAVHVFVDVDRAELLVFVKKILAAKEKAGGYAAGPLGIHPILKKEGVQGAFGTALRQAILAHCGEARVSRLTFFLRSETRQSQWIFGIFDKDKNSGTFGRQLIATTKVKDQVLNAGLAIGDSLNGDTSTQTSSMDNLALLLNTEKARLAKPTEQQAAYDAALRIENPVRHSPETMDCVSCHVATPVRRAADKTLGLSSAGNPNGYTSKRSLAFDAPPRASLENIHAVSYLDGELGLNQRTANETAQVAEAITSLLK